MIPIIKINKYDVYIYGCGEDVDSLINYLIYNGISPKAIFDQNILKAENSFLGNTKVVHTARIKEVIDYPEKSFVLINIQNLSGMDYMVILKNLYESDVDKFYFIPEQERHNVNAFFEGWDNGRMGFYRNHQDELEKTYQMFEDSDSKSTFLEYIRVFMQNGVYNLQQCDGRVKYFFGKTCQNGVFEQLYKLMDKEIWLNAGANIGDTILLYFSLGLKAKVIYAYEGNVQIYRVLVRNLEYLFSLSNQLDLKESVVPINRYITSDTDISFEIKENLTLINADIEGAELSLLEALKDKIVRDRPVISVCVYHKASDLIDIPQWFEKYLNRYTYKLRKYESGVGNITRSAELVMYAIPQERNIS